MPKSLPNAYMMPEAAVNVSATPITVDVICTLSASILGFDLANSRFAEDRFPFGMRLTFIPCRGL